LGGWASGRRLSEWVQVGGGASGHRLSLVNEICSLRFARTYMALPMRIGRRVSHKFLVAMAS